MTDRQKILELIYKNREGHIGSCLSCVEIIKAIYEVIRPQDFFILSKAHALRTVEALGYIPQFVKEVCPYGNSLGNGLGIGIGMAIAHPESIIYVVVGDGETDEGSHMEAMKYIERENLSNIKILIDCNGWSSMRKNDTTMGVKCHGHSVIDITQNLKQHRVLSCMTIKAKGISWLENTLECHYIKLNEAQQREALQECALN